MTSENKALEQVKSYLATLSPAIRAKLVSEIESKRRSGQADPAHDVVLRLMRDVVGGAAGEAPATETPEELFSAPIEPFLVDEQGGGKHEGFISRKAFEAVWRWMQREPATADAITVALNEADAALKAGDEDRAAAVMAKLRADMVPSIQQAVRSAAEDPRQQMNLSIQLEGERHVEDLGDIAAVLRLEARIARLTGKLPSPIEELDGPTVNKITRRLKDDPSGDLIYLLIAIYRQLEYPAQLIRLLTLFEGTDDGARLCKSRYAACAEILLADMDFAAERIAQYISRPTEFDALLTAIRKFYALANGLSVAVELEGAPDWRKRLAAMRRRASEILSSEVETIPGAVRRALRPRRRDNQPTAASAEEVAEAEYSLRLMVGLKPYRAELAVNELLGTVASQVEQFMEAANTSIVQEMRTASGAARDIARRNLDAAVRLNTVVFGDQYAALLKRSGEVAAPMPTRADGTADDADAGAVTAA